MTQKDCATLGQLRILNCLTFFPHSYYGVVTTQKQFLLGFIHAGVQKFACAMKCFAKKKLAWIVHVSMGQKLN